MEPNKAVVRTQRNIYNVIFFAKIVKAKSR